MRRSLYGSGGVDLRTTSGRLLVGPAAKATTISNTVFIHVK